MSGKSRRGHPPRSKRGKGKWSHPVTVPQQQAVAQSYKPAPRPEVSAPSVSAPTPVAAQTVVHYPYIVTELRTIGILAGAMLAILVVLALILA
jgi:hypothetical protein